MKKVIGKKNLLISVLFVFISLTGITYATGESVVSEKDNKIQQQLQVDNQVKIQAGQQLQVEGQVNVQTKGQLQDGSGNIIQNQNQIENKGEENKIQNSEQEGTEKQDKANLDATQRRSQVANAVQEMLQVADRNRGIGQQVRVIAQTQTENKEKLELGLEKVQTRSNFAKFFIGPKYGEIDNLENLLEQNKEQINQLNQIKVQISNSGDEKILTEQIKTLEQYNLEIETSLSLEQKGFSLLGWLAKML
jgi:hypothetical protein